MKFLSFLFTTNNFGNMRQTSDSPRFQNLFYHSTQHLPFIVTVNRENDNFFLKDLMVYQG